MKPTYVLGINAVFHESAAALLRDGRLLAFAEEERFNRIKHGKPPTLRFTGKLPWKAIDYCLRTAGLRLSDVNYFGYSFDPKQLLQDTVGSTGEKKAPLRDPR
jgi:carbamoyltransferase